MLKAPPIDSAKQQTGRRHLAGRRMGGVLLWVAVAIAVLVGLYAVVGFWWLPRLVAADLPPWLAQRYGLRLTLGPVRFNPFNFNLEAKNVALHTSDGAPLLQAESLSAAYAPSGLFHRTWTLSRLTVTSPTLDLVRAKSGAFNLLELLDRLAPPGAAPSGTPPRVAIDRLEVVRGRVKFSDLRGPTATTALISPIAFSMSDLSTVPGRTGTQTLDATLPDGATLHEHGDLVLEPALAAQGQFALLGLQARTWLPFVRNDFRIERLEGGVRLSASYAYGQDPGLRLSDAAIHLTDLLLAVPGVQAPLVTMNKIDATGGELDIAEHSVSFKHLALAQGQVSLAIAADGRLGWADLVPPASAAPPAVATPGAKGSGWGLSVAALQMDKVGFSYDDRQRQPPLIAHVGSLDGGLRLTVATGAPAAVTVENATLTAHDVAVPAASRDGPGLKVDRVTIQGGSFDLAARRIAAQDVSIKGGNVSAERNADGSIDWLRRFAPASGSTASTRGAGDGWHYDIANAGIDGVGIALKDRSLTPAFSYDLRIESATAQHLANVGKAPVRFEATLHARKGGTLHAKGSVTPEGADLHASLQVNQLALAPFQPLAKRYSGFDVNGGPLTLSANLDDARGLSVDHLDFGLPKLVVRRDPGATPLLSAARVQVHGGQVDVAKRRVVIGQLTLAEGAARARMQADGRLDWEVAANRPAASRAARPVAGEPWNVRIKSLKLTQMAARYADSNRSNPWRLDIDRVDLGMTLQLSAGGPSTQVAAQHVQAQVHGAALTVDERKPPALALVSATLSGGAVDLAAHRLTADQLLLTDGDTRIVRDAQGHIAPLDLFVSAPRATAIGAAPAKKGSPWQYDVGDLQVRNFAIEAKDRSITPPLAVDAHLDATARHLSNHGPASFDATLSLGRAGGSVEATGTATLATGAVQAKVVAKSLDLAPLQPLISRYTTLALRSGSAESDLTVGYAPGASADLRASGKLHVDKLALGEVGQSTRLLAVDKLDADQIDFSSAGRRLSVGEVNLLGPDIRIAIAKDRSVNLTDVVKPRAADTMQKTATRPDAPASAPSFQLGVERMRIRGGSVDFSDQSLVLPFATRVTSIDATIAGISNDDTRRADVQARGSIQAYGSASVDGSIAPFDPRRYTDLHVKFNNVLVRPFSPYTATFAGRKVQSGKLWLDLDYKIDRGKLLGKNDVRLSDFTLGERVDSASASDLPLSLAVSLLTDAKGEIHLSVPVRGNLDNPHFDVGKVIAQAIGQTIKRIVTAPFRMLGRLFGGGSETLDDSIDFTPGSASLAPPQREKLDALTKALKQRPLLQLVVSAPYDAHADTLALQQAEVRRELAKRLKEPAPANDGSSVVAFDDPATRSALLAMAGKQGGQDTAAASSSPASRADARAAYKAMFDRIARQQSLSPGAAQILATRRAEVIAQYLGGNGIERGRVQTGKVQSVPVSDAGTVDARLQMSTARP